MTSALLAGNIDGEVYTAVYRQERDDRLRTIMKKILVDQKFDPGIRKVIVGPCNDRPGAVELGNNQSITQEEAAAFEEIRKAGYDIDFALIKEKYIGDWQKFRGKFGFTD